MHPSTSKKYLIKTFGCQANIADSSQIAGILEALNFEATTSLEIADILIINTCSVRQKSEDKVYGFGKKLKELKLSKGRKPFTILAGCMVGSVTGERQRATFDTLKNKTPWADYYINPSQIHEVPKILYEHALLDAWAVAKTNPHQFVVSQKTSHHAFINISMGCDNFCTFCVVPYARGKEVSRSKAEILAEVTHYLKRGITAVTLCGQNVNSWGLDTKQKFAIRTGEDYNLPFAQLLRDIHDLPQLKSIDFISSNPFDFTNDLIHTLNLPKISNYLHIAVQSGNNEVLKRMNRRHTIEEFIELVTKIKAVKPQVEFGTDIIVGFPGETEAQFMDTVKLVETIKFNVAFISIYSPRKGTPAERFFPDDVPLDEKKRRHAYLTSIWHKTKAL